MTEPKCNVPIYGHWHIEDSPDGWYVVRPYGVGRCGPFTEDEASRQLPLLQERYPVEEPGKPGKETR